MAGTSGFPHVKEWFWIPTSHHIQKLTKTDQDQNIRAKPTKLIQESIGVNLHDLRLGNGF